MAQFILVHGAWHAGWCWDQITPLLHNEGHSTIVVDLPSHGSSNLAKEEVTLPMYAEYVEEIVRAQPQKSILVGHSMGGIVVSQTAELVPKKLESIVYVCAFLPSDGSTLLSYAGRDKESLVLPNLEFSENGNATINKDAAASVFYGECSREVATSAIQRLEPQSGAPLDMPVSLSHERFGRVPKYYVRCTRDRAISIGMQDEMLKNWPMSKVETLDTDHSPFFSKTRELSGLLLGFVR